MVIRALSYVTVAEVMSEISDDGKMSPSSSVTVRDSARATNGSDEHTASPRIRTTRVAASFMAITVASNGEDHHARTAGAFAANDACHPDQYEPDPYDYRTESLCHDPANDTCAQGPDSSRVSCPQIVCGAGSLSYPSHRLDICSKWVVWWGVVRLGILDPLTAAVDALLAADHRDGSLVDLVADIAGLHTQEQRLAAVKLAMIRACDADSGHHLAGHATTGAMLTDALRLAPGQGQSMLKTARLLATTFPATAQALEQGLISYPHAAAITRAKAKLPADRLADAEPLLLQVAAAGSAAMVRAAVDHMAELLEPEHHDQQDQDTRARRYLNVSATLDGWWAVDGHLPPEVAERLSAALEDFAAPADPTDPRTARPAPRGRHRRDRRRRRRRPDHRHHRGDHHR